MIILNAVTEQEIKQACFQFEHKGFTISISSMFGRYEVLAFNSDTDIQAYSVEDAIIKVNTFVAKVNDICECEALGSVCPSCEDEV